MKQKKLIKTIIPNLTLFLVFIVLSSVVESCAWYMYAKAIQKDMREQCKKGRAYVYDLSFKGTVVDKNKEGMYYITLLLDQMNPDPALLSVSDRFFMRHFQIFVCDSIAIPISGIGCQCDTSNLCYLKISIPESAYNQIKNNDYLKKESRSFYFETNDKRLPWLNPTNEKKWFP